MGQALPVVHYIGEFDRWAQWGDAVDGKAHLEQNTLDNLQASIHERPDHKHYVVLHVGEPKTWTDWWTLPHTCLENVERVRKMAQNLKPIIVINAPSHRIYSIANKLLIGAGCITALCELAIAGTVALNLAGKVSRFRLGIVALGVLAVIGVVNHVVPYKIYYASRGNIDKAKRLIVQSLWERLYRPIFENTKDSNTVILNLRRSVEMVEDTIEGIAYIVKEHGTYNKPQVVTRDLEGCSMRELI